MTKNSIFSTAKRINLGCGSDIRKGFLNIDFEKFSGVEAEWDLNKLPYPFSDNQVEEIIMRNVLEHLDSPYQIMKEIYRISKPGAVIHIRVPHFSSNNVWGDIQHKRGFNTETFRNKNMSMFKVVKQEITFSNWKFFMRPIVKLNPVFYERHFAYMFGAVDLVLDLKVIK